MGQRRVDLRPGVIAHHSVSGQHVTARELTQLLPANQPNERNAVKLALITITLVFAIAAGTWGILAVAGFDVLDRDCENAPTIGTVCY